ncbi:MAG: hypothetical protein FWC26_04635 [Fibromonadales bacterium]|nr:hypothetical protein [Fibromonadales bacterium]
MTEEWFSFEERIAMPNCGGYKPRVVAHVINAPTKVNNSQWTSVYNFCEFAKLYAKHLRQTLNNPDDVKMCAYGKNELKLADFEINKVTNLMKNTFNKKRAELIKKRNEAGNKAKTQRSLEKQAEFFLLKQNGHSMKRIMEVMNISKSTFLRFNKKWAQSPDIVTPVNSTITNNLPFQGTCNGMKPCFDESLNVFKDDTHLWNDTHDKTGHELTIPEANNDISVNNVSNTNTEEKPVKEEKKEKNLFESFMEGNDSNDKRDNLEFDRKSLYVSHKKANGTLLDEDEDNAQDEFIKLRNEIMSQNIGRRRCG